MSRTAVFLTAAGGVIAGACVAVSFFIIGGFAGLITTLSVTAGFCVGIAWEDAWKLYRSSRKVASVAHESETAGEKTERHRYNGLSSLAVLLVIVSVCLALCAVALLVTRQQVVDTQHRLTAYTECSSAWQQQFSESYFARYQVAIAVSDAMDDIVTGVAANDRSEFEKAVDRYVALRQKQVTEQATNPLPPFPDVLCGAP